MNKFLDYDAYINEVRPFCVLMEKNNFLCYSRVKDVIFVLDKISEKAKTKAKIEDDIDELFDAGLDYLYTDLTFLKILFEDNFKKDIILFKQYDKIIHYALFLGELSTILENHKGFSKKAKATFEKRIDELLEIVDKRKDVKDNYLEELDVEVDSLIPVDFDFETMASMFEYLAVEVALWN